MRPLRERPGRAAERPTGRGAAGSPAALDASLPCTPHILPSQTSRAAVDPCALPLCLPAPSRRYVLLAAVHVALFGVQSWEARTHCSDWLAGSAVLAAHPGGVWMLAVVLIMQAREGPPACRARLPGTLPGPAASTPLGALHALLRPNPCAPPASPAPAAAPGAAVPGPAVRVLRQRHAAPDSLRRPAGQLPRRLRGGVRGVWVSGGLGRELKAGMGFQAGLQKENIIHHFFCLYLKQRCDAASGGGPPAAPAPAPSPAADPCCCCPALLALQRRADPGHSDGAAAAVWPGGEEACAARPEEACCGSMGRAPQAVPALDVLSSITFTMLNPKCMRVCQDPDTSLCPA